MLVLILIFALGVTSCTPAKDRSPAAHRQDSEVERLLDQYDEAYYASGHPKVGPASIMDSTGIAGFDAVLARIHDEPDFDRYARVLASLDWSNSVDICDEAAMDRLVERLQAFGGLTPTPYPVRYQRCQLPPQAYKSAAQ